MTLKHWAGGSTITYLQNPTSSFWFLRILKGAQYHSCGTLCLTNNAHARKTCVSLKPAHDWIFSRYFKGSSFFITKITLCSNSKSTAERKKNVSRRSDEERRIPPRGWRTMYLGARMKNDVSQRFYGQYMAGIRRKAPRYVVLHSRAEIRSSSSQPSKYWARTSAAWFSHNSTVAFES